MNQRDMIKFKDEYLARVASINPSGLAAQLAYLFLLSLFPFLIFSITLLGYTSIKADDVINLVKRSVPFETASVIADNVRSVLASRNTGLLSFGAIAAMWSASSALNSIINVLDKSYEVTEGRSFLKSRAVAIALTFMMIPAILVSLLLPVFGEKIGRLIFSYMGLSSVFLALWNVARWVLSFCIMIVVLAGIYYFAPHKRLRFKGILAGALFTTVGWHSVSWCFSYYVNHIGNYSAIYGSLGSIIVLMVWFYVVALLIILGGVLNSTLDSVRTQNSEANHYLDRKAG
ncbi:MAG: YihY/virulence factor BrkB family protein [Syntrophobacteraceae bacterium]